jgi:glucuronate isomerase
MPRPFIGRDFLLATRAARRLYHGYAEKLPIYDYHCHLDAKDIADNRQFASITEAWLGGDHYKWRAMRANGVAERLVTGDGTDIEKFDAWARTVPATIGNPLYHWTHLELARCFGVREQLSPRTATAVYGACAAKLREESFRVRGLLDRMRVQVICTTDDPTDSLEHHDRLRQDISFPVTVVPGFRPDPVLAIENPKTFNRWLNRLGASAGMEVRDWSRLLVALRRRIDAFNERGCRLSDHGIEEPYAVTYTESEVRRIFGAARKGNAPSADDALKYRSALLVELGRMYAERKWAWQLHLGALRNVNSRAVDRLGPNSGYDTIGDFPMARGLAALLDRLDAEDRLPKTVLYSLNPGDNAVLAALTGCFQDGVTPGKIQHGSAWWFNDQKPGMEEQLKNLANLGLLPRFIGMLTDSRSFLSYPRHEYFRRILCNLLGGWIESGELPGDWDLVGGVVRDVCWNNAEAYFGIPRKAAVLTEG